QPPGAASDEQETPSVARSKCAAYYSLPRFTNWPKLGVRSLFGRKVPAALRGASRQTAVIDRFSLRRVLTLAFGCAVLIMSLGQACDPFKAIAKQVYYTSIAVRSAFDARYRRTQAL